MADGRDGTATGGAVPEAASQSPRQRGLRLAPRQMAAHPGRGLEASTGWLSQPRASCVEVESKAMEMATLRPESLTVLVDIVNKCNLRCIMCHFSFDEVFYQRSQLMQPDTFAAIARAIRPYTRKLTLSAAYEPTASPHFGEILRIAGTHRFAEIGFLTNGNLLGDALIEAILDSGVTEVCVSVHAARAETYAHILRGGTLERAIGNVEKLLAWRRERGSTVPRVQFNVALMRSNVDELVEIVELAARLGVDAVAFRHLIVFEGLSMEQETLSRHDKSHTNRCIRNALQRARALGVTITNAADFFETEDFPSRSQRVDAPLLSGPPVAVPPRRLADRVNALLRRIGLRAAPLPYAVLPGPLLGSLDTPAGEIRFYAPEIELRGWTLAPDGVVEVAISRDAVPEDPPGSIGRYGFVEIGLARFHNGTRPDVVDAYPAQMHSYRAGWSFALRRGDLPASARGNRLQIQAIARDANGNALLIGQRTARLDAGASDGACHVRCSKPFDSLYIDARSNVFPYSDCHTDQPFGQMDGRSFEDVWHDPRLAALRLDMVAGVAPGMCVRCPLFINRAVDDAATFAPHADFSTEAMR